MKRVKIAFLSVALMCIAALAVFSGCVEPPQKHECPVCQVCEDCDRAVSSARQKDWRALLDWIDRAAEPYLAVSREAGEQDDKEACFRLSQRYYDLKSLGANLWIQVMTGDLAGCKTCGDELVALLTADLAPASDQPDDQLPEEEPGEPAEYEPLEENPSLSIH